MRLMNPVSHVENHPRCRTNADGEPLLPNDLPWRQQLAMYLVSSKLLIDTEEVLQVKQEAPASRAQCVADPWRSRPDRCGGKILALAVVLRPRTTSHPGIL